MNDLKESQETMKQTTDELKKQQDELKNIVDTLNEEKNDLVYIHIFFSFIHIIVFLFLRQNNLMWKI